MQVVNQGRSTQYLDVVNVVDPTSKPLEQTPPKLMDAVRTSPRNHASPQEEGAARRLKGSISAALIADTNGGKIFKNAVSILMEYRPSIQSMAIGMIDSDEDLAGIVMEMDDGSVANIFRGHAETAERVLKALCSYGNQEERDQQIKKAVRILEEVAGYDSGEAAAALITVKNEKDFIAITDQIDSHTMRRIMNKNVDIAVKIMNELVANRKNEQAVNILLGISCGCAMEALEKMDENSAIATIMEIDDNFLYKLANILDKDAVGAGRILAKMYAHGDQNKDSAQEGVNDSQNEKSKQGKKVIDVLEAMQPSGAGNVLCALDDNDIIAAIIMEVNPKKIQDIFNKNPKSAGKALTALCISGKNGNQEHLKKIDNIFSGNHKISDPEMALNEIDNDDNIAAIIMLLEDINILGYALRLKPNIAVKVIRALCSSGNEDTRKKAVEILEEFRNKESIINNESLKEYRSILLGESSEIDNPTQSKDVTSALRANSSKASQSENNKKESSVDLSLVNVSLQGNQSQLENETKELSTDLLQIKQPENSNSKSFVDLSSVNDSSQVDNYMQNKQENETEKLSDDLTQTSQSENNKEKSSVDLSSVNDSSQVDNYMQDKQENEIEKLSTDLLQIKQPENSNSKSFVNLPQWANAQEKVTESEEKSLFCSVLFRIIIATVGSVAIIGIVITFALNMLAIGPLTIIFTAVAVASIIIEIASFALKKYKNRPSNAAD
jgi:hypothetical protein